MQSLKGLSVALTILLVVAALVAIFGAVAFFNRADLLDRSLGLNPPSFGEADDADSLVAGSMGLYMLTLLATGVVFVIWQYRHAKNAQALGVTGGLGPGWAIGGWFIPLANYVLPGIQLFQSSRGSSRERKGAGIVIAWAIVFGLGSVLFSASILGNDTDAEGNIVIESRQDVEDAASSDRTAGAGMVVIVAAAIVATVMVRQLTNRQAEAYASMPQPPAPAAPGGWAAPQPPPPPSAPPSAAPGTWGAPPPPSPPAPGGGRGTPSTPPAEPDDGGPAWPAPPG